jgi:hypothetical protein
MAEVAEVKRASKQEQEGRQAGRQAAAGPGRQQHDSGSSRPPEGTLVAAPHTRLTFCWLCARQRMAGH